jgi:TRAP-type C4-dicarboxylate transport system substrate-binding protein
VVEVVFTYPWYTQTKVPLQNLEYTFPFYTPSPWIAYQTKRDLMKEFPQFMEEVEQYNIKQMFHVSPTVYSIQTTKPINNLWDFTGLKIGVIGAYFGKVLSAAGASPVVVPGYERYTMLQTGVLDGTLDPTAFTHSLKNWELARNCLENRINNVSWEACWINMDAWNSLPAGVQAIIEQVSVEVAEEVSKDLVPQWDQAVFDAWREAGLTFTTLSDEEMARWYNACEDTAAQWATAMEEIGYPGFEIAKRFQDLAEQYGFEWTKRWAVQ